jgi:hypothetical protein
MMNMNMKEFYRQIGFPFVVLCFITMCLATELGEKVKDAWISIWCGREVPQKVLIPGPDGKPVVIEDIPSDCRIRVSGATASMSSLAGTIVALYMLRKLWTSQL